jgi:hypothetical protein
MDDFSSSQDINKQEHRKIFSPNRDDASEQFRTSHKKDSPHSYRSHATFMIVWTRRVTETER